MTGRLRGQISLGLYDCAGLHGDGARKLIDAFNEIGGTVVRFSGVPYDNPYEVVNSEGNIMVADVRHELLSAHTPNSPGMGFIARSRYVAFGKDISHKQVEKVDSVAGSFLEFALFMYPRLQPAYCCIDEAGMNMPTTVDAEARRLTHILWANLFGPPFVEAYGRDFLLGAPGWRTEERGDGSVLYVLSPSFVDRWQVVRAKEVRDYFRTKIPDIRIYRPYKGEYLD